MYARMHAYTCVLQLCVHACMHMQIRPHSMVPVSPCPLMHARVACVPVYAAMRSTLSMHTCMQVRLHSMVQQYDPDAATLAKVGGTWAVNITVNLNLAVNLTVNLSNRSQQHAFKDRALNPEPSTSLALNPEP